MSDNAEASVAGPVIYQVQSGVTGGTDQEFVSVYNNNAAAVEITDWCLNSKSSLLACVAPPDSYTKIFLSPHTYFTVASSAFPSPNLDTLTYPSSSRILLGNDTVTLFDAAKGAVDSVSWSTSRNTLQRKTASPGVLVDTDTTDNDFVSNGVLVVPPAGGLFEQTTLPPDACPNIADYQLSVPVGYGLDDQGSCQQDTCLNIDGLQITPPSGKDTDGAGNCIDHDECDNLDGAQALIPAGYKRGNGFMCLLDLPALALTEVLPNYANDTSGVDTGHEFVEIYNPSDHETGLGLYVISVGLNYEKTYLFPAGSVIGPHEYKAFSDTQLGFTLPNSTTKLKISSADGQVMSEMPAYQDPGENVGWALVGGTWQYTNRPTPGAVNLASIEAEETGSENEATGLEPCPAGKFRNPDTNRCKNIEDATGSLTPCAADQERNPDTNRCRSVFSSGSSLTPCQPGQSRNPETNRCRSIATTTSTSLKPCAANQERNAETNRCRKKTNTATTAANKIKDSESPQFGGNTSSWLLTGGVAAAVAGYGAWEWRNEVVAFGRRLWQLFGKSSPTD
jgi:hypothetical protein